MNGPRPRFELTRVYEDVLHEQAEIIPVTAAVKTARRDFLGFGVGLAAALARIDAESAPQRGTTKPATPQRGSSAPLKVPDKVLSAHKERVSALAISPDGKMLASASSDATIKLWTLGDGTLVTTLQAPGVLALRFSPDSTTLLSSHSDKTVRVRSLPQGAVTRAVDQAAGPIAAIAVSLDGRVLISSAADNNIVLSTLPEGRLLTTLQGHAAPVSSFAIAGDGKTLFSGSRDKTVKQWSLPASGVIRLISTLEGHTAEVLGVAVSPDGTIVASCSADRTSRVWSTADGRLLATLEGHSAAVTALALTPDLTTLVSASFDKTLRLWDPRSGKPTATIEGHQAGISALGLGPDGATVASGDESGTIILWQLATRSFRSFLYDKSVNKEDAITYNRRDTVTGTTVTYTLPCGAPIPPGAVCTCNCVPGSLGASTPRTTTTTGGCYCVPVCTCNKVCTCIPISDKEQKATFEDVDPRVILARLLELKVQRWNYIWDDPSVRHIGPMAQDFVAAFAVGEDDKHICSVDAQGIAFAAIQGLCKVLEERDARIGDLELALDASQRTTRTLESRLAALERFVTEQTRDQREPPA